MLVVLVFLLAVNSLGLGARPFEIHFSRVFGADGAQREHPFQIFTAALGTGRNVAFADQLFEGIAALSTGVLVDGHNAHKDNAANRREQ